MSVTKYTVRLNEYTDFTEIWVLHLHNRVYVHAANAATALGLRDLQFLRNVFRHTEVLPWKTLKAHFNSWQQGQFDSEEWFLPFSSMAKLVLLSKQYEFFELYLYWMHGYVHYHSDATINPVTFDLSGKNWSERIYGCDWRDEADICGFIVSELSHENCRIRNEGAPTGARAQSDDLFFHIICIDDMIKYLDSLSTTQVASELIDMSKTNLNFNMNDLKQALYF